MNQYESFVYSPYSNNIMRFLLDHLPIIVGFLLIVIIMIATAIISIAKYKIKFSPEVVTSLITSIILAGLTKFGHPIVRIVVSFVAIIVCVVAMIWIVDGPDGEKRKDREEQAILTQKANDDQRRGMAERAWEKVVGNERLLKSDKLEDLLLEVNFIWFEKGMEYEDPGPGYTRIYDKSVRPQVVEEGYIVRDKFIDWYIRYWRAQDKDDYRTG